MKGLTTDGRGTANQSVSVHEILLAHMVVITQFIKGAVWLLLFDAFAHNKGFRQAEKCDDGVVYVKREAEMFWLMVILPFHIKYENK